jgi:hypothetical protein
MKKLLLFTALLVSAISFSQVGLGTTSPDASSVLHLSGANQGLLLPRLTTVQRNAQTGILSPVGGIVIYDTTLNAVVISLENGKWKNATTGTEVTTTSGTTTSVGIVGIGTTTVDNNTILDVVSTTKGVLLPAATTDPTGVTGMIYYNTTSDVVRIYNGSAWGSISTN